MNYENYAVIVDGMNIAYRCSYIYDHKQKLATEDGQPTGTIYGFVRHMVKLRDRFPGAEFFVVWEGTNSLEARREIFADYKADRERSEEKPVYSQLDLLGDVLEATGIHQARAENYEADDVIGTMAREKGENGQQVILVSSDRDLLQLVNDHVVLMTPQKEKFYDVQKVIDEYGVPPRLLLSYRSLDGDKSDNLPGLFRFPRKKIAALVTEYEDLESIYTRCEMELTEFQRTTLDEFEDQAFTNEELMRLQSVEDYDLREGNHDKATIEALCDQLEFESIRADLLSFSVKTGFVKTGKDHVDSFYSTFGSTGASQ